MKNELECPVDYVTINENKARLTAFFVLTLAVIFLFTQLWIIPAFLVIDFFIRVNNWGKYSLLGILSVAIIKQVDIKNKPTDRAPKRFAAGVGLVFSTAILVFLLLNLAVVSIALAIVIVVFAFLESIVGFCAGCYVYTILKKMSSPLKIK
jgi:Domain of unknown function (DUF4395)